MDAKLRDVRSHAKNVRSWTLLDWQHEVPWVKLTNGEVISGNAAFVLQLYRLKLLCLCLPPRRIPTLRIGLSSRLRVLGSAIVLLGRWSLAQGWFTDLWGRGRSTCNIERVVIERRRMRYEPSSLVGAAVLVDRARLERRVGREDGTAGGPG